MGLPDRQTNPPEPGPCFRCDDEKYIPCPECGGNGWWRHEPTETIHLCETCDGEREIECPYCK